jgi:hypothetical protein
MIRRHVLALIFALPFLALAGCESSTNIEDISATGRWDGVGAVQQSFSGLRLELEEGAGGAITGSWWFGGATGSRSVVSGTNVAGVLDLTFFGLPGGTARFQGRFTHGYRIEGSLSSPALNAQAVFRRTRF